MSEQAVVSSTKKQRRPRKSAQRLDPAPRPVRAVPSQVNGDYVVNKSPHHDYVLTNPLDQMGGTDHYYFLGYEPVLWSDDPSATKLSIGRTGKTGEPITFYGQVLMCIAKARHNEIKQHGMGFVGGPRGLDYFDRIDAKIGGGRKRKFQGVVDPTGGDSARSVDGIEVTTEFKV